MGNLFGNYRTMILSLNSGGMSDRQKDFVVNWVKNKMSSPSDIKKAAHIAYQYDVPEDVIERINALI